MTVVRNTSVVRLVVQPWVAFAAAILSWHSPTLAAPPTPLPGEIVVTIDPAKDLVATRPDWTTIVEQPGPRGTNGCTRRYLKQSEPLAFVPFTVRDLTRAAQRTGRSVTQRTRFGVFQYVRSGSGQLTTFSQYAAELNEMEKFLNMFGRSLHEETNDLGFVAELRDAKISDGCKLEVTKYKPIWRDPRTPIAELIRDWKLEDEVPGWLTSAGDLRAVATELPSPAQKRRLAVRGLADGTPDGLAIASLKNRRVLFGVPAHDVSNGIDRAGDTGGATLFRSTRPLAASPIVNLQLLRGSRGIRFTAPGQSPVTSILKADCPIKIDDGANVECAKGVGMPSCDGGGSSPGTTDNGTQFDVSTKGEPTTCLAEGSFGMKLPAWDGCLKTGGSLNNWFGGSACVTIKSNNVGSNGNFTFEDSVGIGAVATVFGQDLNLLRGDAFARSDSATGPSAPPATISGLVKDLSGGGACCAPIAGPSMYVPIGFTGLQVSTALELTLDMKRLVPTAVAAPKGCAIGPVPVVSVDGNAVAKAGVNFEASISAIVAKAGIGGSLTLVGGELTGSIATVADMGANLLTVTPAMQFQTDVGDGQVYAFVEVDLILVSKKWKLILADWKGSTELKILAHDPGQVRATKPETQEAICTPSSPNS